MFTKVQINEIFRGGGYTYAVFEKPSAYSDEPDLYCRFVQVTARRIIVKTGIYGKFTNKKMSEHDQNTDWTFLQLLRKAQMWGKQGFTRLVPGTYGYEKYASLVVPIKDDIELTLQKPSDAKAIVTNMATLIPDEKRTLYYAYCENTSGRSNKFWEVTVLSGSSNRRGQQDIRFGRKGTIGKTITRYFVDEVEAINKSMDAMQNKTTRKGYRLTTLTRAESISDQQLASISVLPRTAKRKLFI